ncbi:hypothetical protein KY284_036082 [Solanum tuberosum]|nr:hypothetical protein KY284_036082 [Solanum tuberosum]
MEASITNCFLDWGLGNVFTKIVDNASSNRVTMKEMSKQLTNWGTSIMEGQHLHVRCMAHIINLIVQVGLKEVEKRINENETYYVRHKEFSGSSSSKSELGTYLAEDVEPETDEFDILKWWKFNEPRFPILAEMARDVLVIPISSVACAFSTTGRILDPFRSSLTPKVVQSPISLKDWLRSESIPINIEEDLEYLELLELDNAHNGNESSIVDVNL